MWILWSQTTSSLHCGHTHLRSSAFAYPVWHLTCVKARGVRLFGTPAGFLWRQTSSLTFDTLPHYFAARSIYTDLPHCIKLDGDTDDCCCFYFRLSFASLHSSVLYSHSGIRVSTKKCFSQFCSIINCSYGLVW